MFSVGIILTMQFAEMDMIKLLWRSLHISHRCTALQTAFWQMSEYQELCKDVRIDAVVLQKPSNSWL